MTSPPAVPTASQDASSLTTSLLEPILAFAVVRSFAAGEPILAPGAATNTFYFLVSGAVEVSYTDRSDTRITVALIGAGEFFGEIGYFDGESRVRDIQAVDQVRVGIFDSDVMDSLREQHPSLFTDFILFLTQKICGKFRRIAGEREPIAGYADSLSTRHASRYTEAKPLPAPLLHSSQWHSISSRMETFKSELFNLSHRLQKTEAEGKQDLESEARCHAVLAELNGSLADFEQTMAGSGYAEVMWGYVFKEIFPYLMRSRFAERAYFKPKGYAGEFLMMEHIYANIPTINTDSICKYNQYRYH